MDVIQGALAGGFDVDSPMKIQAAVKLVRCALYNQRAREEPLDEARRPLLAWHMRFQCLADTLSLPCARRGFARPFFPVLPRLCSIQADMAAEVVLASSGISMPSACAMFLA